MLEVINNFMVRNTINGIIDSLSSDAEIALSNTFIENMKKATQETRDEVFKTIGNHLKKNKTDDAKSAFLNLIKSDDMKNVFDRKVVGTKLNVVQNENGNLIKPWNEWGPKEYDAIWRSGVCCNGDSNEASRISMGSPWLAQDKARTFANANPTAAREIIYRDKVLSGRPRV